MRQGAEDAHHEDPFTIENGVLLLHGWEVHTVARRFRSLRQAAYAGTGDTLYIKRFEQDFVCAYTNAGPEYLATTLRNNEDRNQPRSYKAIKWYQYGDFGAVAVL